MDFNNCRTRFNKIKRLYSLRSISGLLHVILLTWVKYETIRSLNVYWDFFILLQDDYLARFRPLWYNIAAAKGGTVMARVCAISNRGALSGNKRSHSLRASRRKWNVNLQKVRIMVDGKPVRVRISARELRNLKSQEAKG